MKISSIITTVSAVNIDRLARDRRQVDENRRYSQLVDMMEHYNSEFDERKYWGYGCNCLLLGDRPMSQPGRGRPVDALDSVCKAYKDCLRCAKMEYGDTCIPEMIRYSFGITNGDVVCNNASGSCRRSLCECDRMFAIDHVDVKDTWTSQYNYFDGFNSNTECETGGPGLSDPQCCQNTNVPGPFKLYNAVNKVCCSDGSIGDLGSNC